MADIASLTAQICKLLPSGEAWGKSVGTNLYKTIALFSPAVGRLLDAADNAKRDAFPTSTTTSLSLWQSSVGLPDPFYAGNLTTSQAKSQMIARVCNVGGQSVQYYIDYAAWLGFAITIKELGVPRAGCARAGQSSSGGAYSDHTWTITVSNASRTPFRAGDRAGMRLATTTDLSILFHEFDRIRPAHTLIEWFVP